MSKYTFCPHCRAWDNLDVHRCPPQWTVWVDGDPPEEAHTVYGCDAEDAAREFVEDREVQDCEYDVAGHGGCCTVWVRGLTESIPAKKFDVTGEFVPTYYAHEAEPPEEGEACTSAE